MRWVVLWLWVAPIITLEPRNTARASVQKVDINLKLEIVSYRTVSCNIIALTAMIGLIDPWWNLLGDIMPRCSQVRTHRPTVRGCLRKTQIQSTKSNVHTKLDHLSGKFICWIQSSQRLYLSMLSATWKRRVHTNICIHKYINGYKRTRQSKRTERYLDISYNTYQRRATRWRMPSATVTVRDDSCGRERTKWGLRVQNSLPRNCCTATISDTAYI